MHIFFLHRDKINYIFNYLNDNTLEIDVSIYYSSKMEIDDSAAATGHFIQRLMEEIMLRMPTDESRIRKTKEYWCLLWKSLPITEMQAREVLRESDLQTVIKKISYFSVRK